MTFKIIGTCSLCGGNVVSPWWGISAPLPYCDSCGATVKKTRVIEMEPKFPNWTWHDVVTKSPKVFTPTTVKVAIKDFDLK